jgi:predicted permease
MVLILLAIACANVATLLAARGSARAGEMAVRSSLGASRGRLVRQLSAEALMIAAGAGGLGVLIAASSMRLLAAMLPAGDAPVAIDVSLDGRVLLFGLLIAVAAALPAALAPVVPSLRVHPARALGGRWQHTSETRAGGRMSRPFIAAQVALALVLVAASGLLARSLIGLRRSDTGFDVDRLLAVTVDPGAREYTSAATGSYYRELLERLAATPGVASATLTQAGLLERFWTSGTVEVAGFTPASEDDRWVQVFHVGPRFFATLGMTVVAGRDFADQDMSGRVRVAAINETAAARFFGGASAIGRRIASEGDFEIVAVVRDAHYNNLRDAPRAALFVPYASVRSRTRMTFYTRSAAAPAAMAAAVQARARSLDPLVPVTVVPVSATREAGLGQERLLSAISLFFAGSAVLLLVVGLSGVMSFAVNARRQEIGIRLALGATRGHVAIGSLASPLGAVAVGAGLGIVLTLSGARAAGALVFGLAPQDPATIAGALLVIALTATAAAWLPARRAARVDPAVTLRAQ